MENQTSALSYDNMNAMPALYAGGPSGRYKQASDDMILAAGRHKSGPVSQERAGIDRCAVQSRVLDSVFSYR